MRTRILLFLVVVVAIFCLAPSPAAHAQNLYAAIHGTVTDASGAVVPNASVTVVNTSTNITTKASTDARGYFTVPQLQVGGPYKVTISASGFQTFTATGMNLSVNDNRDVSAKLQVGSSNTTVEVSASSLQVETADTQLKQVMTATQLEQIPLAGRDPQGLQKLQPGVVEASDRFGAFSSDGSQTPQNSYLLNGVDINDGPLQDEGFRVNPDALQEESVIVSTLNPEYARNSGATLNQVVKAGTNHFHGNVFEFYRDTFLNSTPYFAQTVPQFHQNLYGATLGGPVLRNKFFFFLAYQGLRNRTGGANASSTLSTADFNGDFTGDFNYATGGLDGTGLTENNLPFDIPGPDGMCTPEQTWNQCFGFDGSGAAATSPSGHAIYGLPVMIDPSAWNPVAAAATAKYIPHPNQGTDGLNAAYFFNTANTDAEDQGIIRLDYTPTSHDTVWGSVIFQSSPSFDTLSFGGGSFPGFAMVNAEHIKIFSGAYTHTFNATTLNELRAGYYRLNFASVEPANPIEPSAAGFTGIVTQGNVTPGYPYLSIGSFALGNSYEGPQPRLDSNLSFADNFTKIVGSHSLKFGVSFEQFRVSNPFAYLNNGYYYWGGGSLYSSGDPYLDFEMGIPDGYEQTSNGDINAMSTEKYAYAQDSWKVSPDVTLNYGVGWDVEAPTTNAQFDGLGMNCWSNSTVESKVYPGAPPGLAFPGDAGCNRAGGPTTHYNRFGPRVGFAWSPSSGPSKIIGEAGTHSFSLRGGFGVYYNRDQEEQSLQNLEDPPFLLISQGVADVGGTPSLADPWSDVAGAGSIPSKFPYAVPTPGDTNIDWQGLYYMLGLATFAPNYSVPYTMNFNLNIQRSLPSNMLLQIGYVGSLSHRLASWYDGDYITPEGHAACVAHAPITIYGTPHTCDDSAIRSGIHKYFPQFTSAPELAYPAGVFAGFPNGIPWYVSVARQNTEGSSNYNSLQISLIKARTHGLYFTASYTYSHSLDDGSGYESSIGSGGPRGAGIARNYTPGFTYLNYGDSDFDARQRLAVSYIYEIPVFAAISSRPILRETVAGWELSGVTALQSGFPVSFSQGQTLSLWCDGSSYFGCADVPMTSTFHIKKENPRKFQTINGQTGNFYFDTSSFSSEPLGTYGNTKRNFFHGPGYNYTNLRFSKNFRIGNAESRYLQLGIEAFNAFNHANFNAPHGDFTGSGFGTVRSVVSGIDPNSDPEPGRVYQLMGKFYF